ncbi:MAG: ACT domain-containing protein [Mycobacteriales bacterium]
MTETAKPTTVHPHLAHSATTDLRPELDPTPLSVARYPAGWWPPMPPSGYLAFVVDHDEVTVVAPDAMFEAIEAPDAIEPGWRRITFAGPLPWEMVGFLADVAERLAAARIPFTSMSGFSTDHVLVRAAQAGVAVAVLKGEQAPDLRPDVTNP